ncbi:molybdenum cofactor guanylyltransferase [Fontisphaera persica]|uniref:molybdenum cofactor guanylyltransferase n=1 Tax=Fontisphaera persica TaxID=2974023 RepID=UPI0024BFA1E4|nr:molybdenum cofactor guanylyltransferase [Fontisphaera persica]WCJ60110.1 molybdenum cofactor guanylyltransferase [Fontisphaera persica]
MNAPPGFTAMVLAGGQSTRMGRDKVWLEVDGQPLIHRQLSLLKHLQPEAILVSSPLTKATQTLGVPVIPDYYPAQGPLAGIERGLATMTSPLLLVLAVDMPHMNVEILQRLLHHATPESGVVPVVKERLEPLAAIYPRCALASARAFLEEGCNSATQFAEWTLHLGLTRRLMMPEHTWAGFANWNYPENVRVK